MKIITNQQITFLNMFACVLTCFAAGIFINFISSLFKSELLNKWIGAFFIEIIGLIYITSIFVFNSFKVFNDIDTILGGANGVLTEFSSAFWTTVYRGLGTIGLYEIPFIAYILLFIIFKILSFKRINKTSFLILLISFVVFEGSGIAIMLRSENYKMKLTNGYCFDLVTQTFSLGTAYKLDAAYLLFGNPFDNNFYETDSYLDSTNTDSQEYGKSHLNLDFNKQTYNKKINLLNEYISSQETSSKNQYTGLFKGKNIIFITAESLSSQAIRQDLTPTLYRLKETGICFTDYYEPYYNSSTVTGEYANLLGLIPTSGMKSVKETIGKNLYLTIGNETLRQNYTNYAYHNGTLTYYDRNITHINYGYSKFIAQGNGMETALSGTWPESDLEMMKYSIDQYINQTPFCIYYMTITPHFPYFNDLSVMTEKYGNMTNNLGYSSYVEAYLTATIDFDKAMEYLLQKLAENDLLDDTVIVIAPDHYPYGLTKADTYGTDKNYLPELYGYEPENVFQRDSSSLIIWSGALEKQEPIVVSEPVGSIDILPTLLNLFGLEYDSRLLAGRDVFSDALPLVIWPDHSWISDKGYYISSTDTFVATDSSADKEYAKEVQKIVANKMTFSRLAIETDYYNYLFN